MIVFFAGMFVGGSLTMAAAYLFGFPRMRSAKLRSQDVVLFFGVSAFERYLQQKASKILADQVEREIFDWLERARNVGELSDDDEPVYDPGLCPLCAKGPEVAHVACNRAIQAGLD